MVFTSLAFLKFFAVVLTGLILLPRRAARQALLLVASFYFYAYWKASYVFLLAAPIGITYVAALRIADSIHPGERRTWLRIAVIACLGLLGYYKYTNFFLLNLSGVLPIAHRQLSIVLPIGISFYTFKVLSYVVDVHRGHIAPCRSLWRYAMFVSYFPELIAGPIVRASVFLPQMQRSLRFSWNRLSVGAQVILLGVTKKLLVADNLSEFVDPVFAHPEAFSSFTVLSAVVAYSLQIYCDFSGYSDIAIGVSKIIGFDLPENFNMPYLATSMVDFWRRWHITLSHWLRDYLYFSLGGVRKPLNRYRNILVTMTLGGLWHGASWNFVVWGVMHGVALAVNQWLEDRRRKRGLVPSQHALARMGKWVLTYGFVCATWIVFRSAGMAQATTIFRKVLFLEPGGFQWLYSPLAWILLLAATAHWLGWLVASTRPSGGVTGRLIAAPEWLARIYARQPLAVRPSQITGVYPLLPFGFAGAFFLTGWVAILYLFGALNASPFIYFQF